MDWFGVDEDNKLLSMMLLHPEWSADSKRVFYTRAINDLSYVGSVEIATGEDCIHTFGDVPVVSPDGQWVLSVISEDVLVVAKIDGSQFKYFKPECDLQDGYDIGPAGDSVFWSSDSKKICIAQASALRVIDLASGRTHSYVDPEDNEFAYFTPATESDKVYYIAADSNEGNVEELKLKYVSLSDYSSGVVFTLRDLPEYEDEERARFCISPNGKTVLLRTVVEDPRMGEGCPALIFWDGKTQKTVKTYRWLIEPVCSDDDLIFDERLLGKWKNDDGLLSITPGDQDRTYRIRIGESGAEFSGSARLIQLKDKLLLGMFFDESTMMKKEGSVSQLCPDVLVRIYQIEPTLILRAIAGYNTSAILEEDADVSMHEILERNDFMEYEPVP